LTKYIIIIRIIITTIIIITIIIIIIINFIGSETCGTMEENIK